MSILLLGLIFAVLVVGPTVFALRISAQADRERRAAFERDYQLACLANNWRPVSPAHSPAVPLAVVVLPPERAYSAARPFALPGRTIDGEIVR